MKLLKLFRIGILLVLAACGGGVPENAPPPSQFLATAVVADYRPLVQQLYIAFFGRPADVSGLASFSSQLLALNAPTDIQQLNAACKTNLAINSLVNSFASSAESLALYSGDNVAFVTAIYKNVLNRSPDVSGLTYWAGLISSGELSRGCASLAIMAGALTNNSTQGKLDASLINNKVAVGAAFTAAVAAGPVDGFKGDAAAEKARSLLRGLTATTSASAVEQSITSLVKELSGVANVAPVANAGANQQIVVGMTVSLDGSSSFDANKDRLTYEWSITAKPAGSTAALSSVTSVNPTFIADKSGIFTISLKVSDGLVSSATSSMSVTSNAPVFDTQTYTCGALSQSLAQQLYLLGHTYLDRDHDGKPCEASDVAIEKTTTTGSPSTSGMCYVNGYFRSNGTYVSGYYRRC